MDKDCSDQLVVILLNCKPITGIIKRVECGELPEVKKLHKSEKQLHFRNMQSLESCCSLFIIDFLHCRKWCIVIQMVRKMHSLKLGRLKPQQHQKKGFSESAA